MCLPLIWHKTIWYQDLHDILQYNYKYLYNPDTLLTFFLTCIDYQCHWKGYLFTGHPIWNIHRIFPSGLLTTCEKKAIWPALWDSDPWLLWQVDAKVLVLCLRMHGHKSILSLIVFKINFKRVAVPTLPTKDKPLLGSYFRLIPPFYSVINNY